MNQNTDHMAARIAADTHHEADVTRTMGLLTGDLADQVASILCAPTQQSHNGPLDLWSGDTWLTFTGHRRPGDRRAPDIIVTGADSADRVVLIVEVKGLAMVNAGHTYCPVHTDQIGYSNQVICYASNCWTTADLTGVPRLVLGPDSHQGVYGGWGLKAIRDTDVELVGPASFEAQQHALRSWTSMGLRTFTRRLADLPASPRRDDLLRTLNCWLERCGL